MLSKRVLVLISCLAGVAGLGVAAIGVAPALAETAAPPADPAELEELRLAADRGDAAAQNNLGMMYYDGDGVAQNYGEAVRYFRLAADQGDAGANSPSAGCMRKEEVLLRAMTRLRAIFVSPPIRVMPTHNSFSAWCMPKDEALLRAMARLTSG